MCVVESVYVKENERVCESWRARVCGRERRREGERVT